MDKSIDELDLKLKKKSLDDHLDEPADRDSRHSEDSMDNSKGSLDGSLDNLGRHSRSARRHRVANDDLDGPASPDISGKSKDPPRRTLSSEMDSSIVLGQTDEKSWDRLDTVHKAKFNEFASGSLSDSTSLMEDSFAGSSFASAADSWHEYEQQKVSDNFQTLDDDPKPASLVSPTTRRLTPKRTYSRQKKAIPKKRDPLMAISEAEDGLD